MAEKIISPGVFTNEIDQTFLPSAVADIGAAIIGPTLKGPAGIPTIVTSYSDFQAKFGDVVKAGVGAGGTTNQFLTSHAAEEYLRNSDTLTVVRIMDGTFGPASAEISKSDNTTAFTLKTLADGTIANNAATMTSTGNAISSSYQITGSLHFGTNQILLSGSKHNIRYEVSNVNYKKGSFSVSIRAGNDNVKRKQILESYTNVNLDPNSPNYIAKAIGDQRFGVKTDGTTKYLQLTGSYRTKSRFVTVDSVATTPDYLDENGNVNYSNSASLLPNAGSGSSGGGFIGGTDGFSGFDALGNNNGTTGVASTVNFYENINVTDTQGFSPTDLTTADGGAAYSEALDLLANQDEFDINLLMLPGLVHSLHPAVLNKAIDTCENRGDCFAIIDPVAYGKNPSDAVTQAEAKDSNFSAMYYPWVKVQDSQIAGTQRWVPPSVVLGGMIELLTRGLLRLV